MYRVSACCLPYSPGLLLQDYFGTILGTISSTTNSTKIVPETTKKMAYLEEVSDTILGTIFGTISSM